MTNGPQIVKAAAFEPSSMPGILLITRTDQIACNELEKYIAKGQNIVSSPLKHFMEDELERAKGGTPSYVFYINTKNSLMQKLRETAYDERVPSQLTSNVLEEVYHDSRTFANASFGAEEHILEHRNKLLTSLFQTIMN